MNMFKLFRANRDRVQMDLDKIIMDSLTTDEQYGKRQEIMAEFDGLLDHIQLYNDELCSIKGELEETNKLLKQLCRGES